METDLLDFDLPADLVAVAAASPRDAARLMVIRRQLGDELPGPEPGPIDIAHHRVRELPSLDVLEPGDVLVVNRSKVVPALIAGQRDATGGKVTGLFLNELNEVDAPDGGSSPSNAQPGLSWQVMLESRGTLRVGETITLAGSRPGPTITLVQKHDAGVWQVRVASDESTWSVLDRVGQVPLPPYIRKARNKLGMDEQAPADRDDYKTIYADQPGSVAAPTAGLHLTPSLLASLDALGVQRCAVTLHVGMGTFMPVRSDTLEDHVMHSEPWTVTSDTLAMLAKAKRDSRRVLAVGTTTVRALESLPSDWQQAHGDLSGHTDLFIHPESNHRWRVVDCLMTNFHLPRSTLLALVASLPGMGLGNLKAAYAAAIEHHYRFYSYGDAMLIV